MNDEEIADLIHELHAALKEQGFDWVLSDIAIDETSEDSNDRRKLALALVDGLAAATADLAEIEAHIELGDSGVIFKPGDFKVSQQEIEPEDRKKHLQELRLFNVTITQLRRSISGDRSHIIDRD